MAKRKLLSMNMNHFKSAHHWVTDDSITEAIQSGKKDDPMIPWTEKTNRAVRIGTMVQMMWEGVEFPPLAIRIIGEHVELEDGHHRLRALQYSRWAKEVAVSVAYGPPRMIALKRWVRAAAVSVMGLVAGCSSHRQTTPAVHPAALNVGFPSCPDNMRLTFRSEDELKSYEVPSSDPSNDLNIKLVTAFCVSDSEGTR